MADHPVVWSWPSREKKLLRTVEIMEEERQGRGTDKCLVKARRGNEREARGGGREENNICSHGAFVFA
jgi:hypothetical protein